MLLCNFAFSISTLSLFFFILLLSILFLCLLLSCFLFLWISFNFIKTIESCPVVALLSSSLFSSFFVSSPLSPFMLNLSSYLLMTLFSFLPLLGISVLTVLFLFFSSTDSFFLFSFSVSYRYLQCVTLSLPWLA